MKIVPELNDDETLQDWVDYMNGELSQRKGTPPKEILIDCYYCGHSFEILVEDIHETDSFNNCERCIGAAQRNNCG